MMCMEPSCVPSIASEKHESHPNFLSEQGYDAHLPGTIFLPSIDIFLSFNRMYLRRASNVISFRSYYPRSHVLRLDGYLVEKRNEMHTNAT